jgi:hypothetical protein
MRVALHDIPPLETEWAKPPHVGAVDPDIYAIDPALGKDVKFFLKLFL